MPPKRTMGSLSGTVKPQAPVKPITVAAAQGKHALTMALPTIGKIPSDQANIKAVLGQLEDSIGDPLLLDDQYKKLEEITLTDGQKFFSFTAIKRPLLYQIISQIYLFGFDSVYESLISKQFASIEEYFFHASPSMNSSRQKAKVDNEIFRNKVEVVEGVFKCGKCGSRETVSTEKQMRSADEPMTIFVRCTQCGNKWKA